jgi:hypothetical protein
MIWRKKMNKQSDYKAFIEILSIMAQYYNVEKSKAVLNLYWETLNNLTIEQFKIRANELVKTNKFFPAISEFLEIENKDEKGIKAWQKVLYAFKVIGCYKSVQFDDPVIHSAIEMLGGWRRFNEMTIEERKWAEKDFYKYYSALSNKSDHPK